MHILKFQFRIAWWSHLFVAWRCQLALNRQNTCARKHTNNVSRGEWTVIDPGALRSLILRFVGLTMGCLFGVAGSQRSQRCLSFSASNYPKGAFLTFLIRKLHFGEPLNINLGLLLLRHPESPNPACQSHTEQSSHVPLRKLLWDSGRWFQGISFSQNTMQDNSHKQW